MVTYPDISVDIHATSLNTNIPISVHWSTDYQLVQTETERIDNLIVLQNSRFLCV